MSKYLTKAILVKVFVLQLIVSVACRRSLEPAPPISSITTEKVFIDDKSAVSAVNGIYSKMNDDLNISSFDFCNRGITVLTGLSSDELTPGGVNPSLNQFLRNDLMKDNGYILYLWQRAYAFLYQINMCIEGLENSKSLSENTANQLVGETLFLRAFIHFYLFNLYGDIPIATTSDWRTNSQLGRSSQEMVYGQILKDLTKADSLLPVEYPTAERVRPNKFAAQFLLARVYLFVGDWDKSRFFADKLISTNFYLLEDDLNNVFKKNSKESILQFKPLDLDPYATMEGNTFFIENADNGFNYNFFLTDKLLNSFDLSDKRKQTWIGTVERESQHFYFPAKYKIKYGQPGSIDEYYVVFRYAELFFIRAESNARMNQLSMALDDLNRIRLRAGLPVKNVIDDSEELLKELASEKRKEFFSEWGHRWFDLKRWGFGKSILELSKGTINNFYFLYPIPAAELLVNPNIKQNPGYN
ncbi:RagB/SusD family nutrient uptake outer membrane protein [Pseudoflavitalea sp. X16]|uniref:RagB/SusD family nutrient uptake outer membrane protein n=1 Tax=Paraflavitalea devenefica TaxID=2716334 RepID=UPI0014204913|nr:RagB/SusD family nutrient uptake outer membrane protein [Paraflavitalea devenefica]NII27495.1 RagB/SusD family nutrient uptake outer membrane protein [Paraflavitalea devenefica]